ncbi:hypothetical protein PAPYR_6966 [Paratrimastix pyriformis]|uniref:F-box domain-containing protein n=1 Tax=Paratrimastix pyriformis TaxID=342808 RepID=A0ABQ8UFF6_9EUKA|nr:hypothetical protein PAPYR_6966 [Paratrimastix pyriformis]
MDALNATARIQRSSASATALPIPRRAIEHIPTLYEICQKSCQANIKYISNVGDVPAEFLQPIFEHASPEDLIRISSANPNRNDFNFEDKFRDACMKRFFPAVSNPDDLADILMEEGDGSWQFLYQQRTIREDENFKRALELAKEREKDDFAHKVVPCAPKATGRSAAHWSRSAVVDPSAIVVASRFPRSAPLATTGKSSSLVKKIIHDVSSLTRRASTVTPDMAAATGVISGPKRILPGIRIASICTPITSGPITQTFWFTAFWGRQKADPANAASCSGRSQRTAE